MAKPELPAAREPVQTSAQPVPMSAEERALFYKQRRSRSVALALALGGVVIIFYIVSLIQGPGILERSL